MANSPEANRLLREANVLGPDDQLTKQFQINPDLLKFLRENLNINAEIKGRSFSQSTYLEIQLRLGQEVISDTRVDMPNDLE